MYVRVTDDAAALCALPAIRAVVWIGFFAQKSSFLAAAFRGADDMTLAKARIVIRAKKSGALMLLVFQGR